MTTQKKIASVPADALAAARLRAEQTRQQLGHEPGPTKLLTPQELADAAPFYLVLRDYIRQLHEAREAAGFTLADVSARSVRYCFNLFWRGKVVDTFLPHFYHWLQAYQGFSSNRESVTSQIRTVPSPQLPTRNLPSWLNCTWKRTTYLKG